MPFANQILHLEVAGVELANREGHAGETARRDHRGDTAAIGQSRVENRLRFRDIVAQSPGDILDGDHERSFAERHPWHLLQEALFFNEYPVRSIHHHFADGVIENQVLDGLQERQNHFESVH